MSDSSVSCCVKTAPSMVVQTQNADSFREIIYSTARTAQNALFIVGLFFSAAPGLRFSSRAVDHVTNITDYIKLLGNGSMIVSGGMFFKKGWGSERKSNLECLLNTVILTIRVLGCISWLESLKVIKLSERSLKVIHGFVLAGGVSITSKGLAQAVFACINNKNVSDLEKDTLKADKIEILENIFEVIALPSECGLGSVMPRLLTTICASSAILASVTCMAKNSFILRKDLHQRTLDPLDDNQN